MLRGGASVLGDEQVLDVELDRHTVLRPAANSTQALNPWFSPRIQVGPGPAIPGVSSNHFSAIGAYLPISFCFLL